MVGRFVGNCDGFSVEGKFVGIWDGSSVDGKFVGPKVGGEVGTLVGEGVGD